MCRLRSDRFTSSRHQHNKTIWSMNLTIILASRWCSNIFRHMFWKNFKRLHRWKMHPAPQVGNVKGVGCTVGTFLVKGQQAWISNHLLLNHRSRAMKIKDDHWKKRKHLWSASNFKSLEKLGTVFFEYCMRETGILNTFFLSSTWRWSGSAVQWWMGTFCALILGGTRCKLPERERENRSHQTWEGKSWRTHSSAKLEGENGIVPRRVY